MKISKRKAAACLIIMLQKNKLAKNKKRSVWVKDWILRREELGVYNQLMNELSVQDSMQFSNFLRLTPVAFEELSCKVGPLIMKTNTKFRTAISVGERLAVTLRFLASGDSYTSLGYLFRILKCTISLIVPEVCKAIISVLKEDYMKVPSTPKEWRKIANAFKKKWNFPNCLGAIDGKHIVIQAPQNSGSFYYNYKGQHSTVLMAVVDADYKFLIVSVGGNGRVSDGGIFRNSGVSSIAEAASNELEKTPLPGRKLQVPYVFVADDAFPLQPHIMKLYPYHSQGSLRFFNYRLSRARRIVENAFGIMSSVFRVLRKPILLAPERVDFIVLAICCLHNYLLTNKSSANVYAVEGMLDREHLETGEVTEGNWRQAGMPAENLVPLLQQGSNNYSNNAKEVREEFREYFVSPLGEVPWQYRLM